MVHRFTNQRPADTDTDDTYQQVRAGVQDVIAWAKDTAEEMSRPEVDERIAEKVSWLLGDDTDQIQAVIGKAHDPDRQDPRVFHGLIFRSSAPEGFQNIAKLQITDEDVYVGQWHDSQSQSDIVSFA